MARNLLILGAGASHATLGLPLAATALGKWSYDVKQQCALLNLALSTWVNPYWEEMDLESAWSQIDTAWNEPSKVPELNPGQRREVWKLAKEKADQEVNERDYYRTQLKTTEQRGWSAEQFLSIAAGWELRWLIQKNFIVCHSPESQSPYKKLITELKPSKVISFNYDTLLEQSLEPGTWTYRDFAAQPEAVAILKPHGSVNWVHRVARDCQLQDELDFGVSLGYAEMGYEEHWLVQNLIVGLRHKIEHTRAERSPVLRGFFERLLRQCKAALVEAERIWIVGYRFAPADTTFLDIVAQAMTLRNSAPSLAVIDKADNDSLVRRIKEIFGLQPGDDIPNCLHGFEKWADDAHSCRF